MDTGEIKYFLTNTHTVKENHIELLKEYIENSKVNIVVDKRLSSEQRKKIWCILDDFAYCLGGDKEQWREQLQTRFCRERDLEYFSISIFLVISTSYGRIELANSLNSSARSLT